MKKGEVVFVEDSEELIPVYRFQRLLRLAEVDSQDAALAFRADHGGAAVSLLNPVAYFVVVGGRLCL